MQIGAHARKALQIALKAPNDAPPSVPISFMARVSAIFQPEAKHKVTMAVIGPSLPAIAKAAILNSSARRDLMAPPQTTLAARSVAPMAGDFLQRIATSQSPLERRETHRAVFGQVLWPVTISQLVLTGLETGTHGTREFRQSHDPRRQCRSTPRLNAPSRNCPGSLIGDGRSIDSRAGKDQP